MRILFSQKLTSRKNVKNIISLFVFLVIIFFPTGDVESAINKQMNYQGKLTTSAGVAVANGTYNMEFALYTVPTGGTAIWTETRINTDKVQVTNGLFSVLLGGVTPLTGVDFNQTLYLGVNIGGTGTPGWDGEMVSRKKLGAVPAAMVADSALTVVSGVYTNAANSFTLINPLTTLAESWIGPSSTAGIYFKGGNVGIGTVSPSAMFQVAGDAYFGASNWVNLKDEGTGNGRFIVNNIGSFDANGFMIRNKAGTTVYQDVNYTSAGNVLFPTGKIGIKNAAPGELLTLGTAGTTAGVLSLAGATSGKAIIQVAAAAGTPTLTLPTTTGTLALVSDLTTGYIPYTGGTSNVDLGLHNLTVDTNSLFVDATNHRVGVGTTSPGAKLDVYGSSTFGAVVRDSAAAGSFLNLGSGGGGTYGFIGYNASIGSQGIIILPTSGNVGIGTTAPGAKFQVNSGVTTDIGAIIKGYAGQTGDLQQWQDSTGTVLSKITSAGNLTLGATAIPAAIGDGGYSRDINQEFYAWNAGVPTKHTYTHRVFNFPGYDNYWIDAHYMDGSYIWYSEKAGAGNWNTAFNAITSNAGYISANGSGFLISGKYVVTGYATNGANIQSGGSDAINITAATAATTGLKIRGAASQTADLQQWINSSGTALTVIDKNGKIGIGNSAPGELLTLGTAGTTAGVLSLAGATSGKAIIQVAAAAGTPTLTLPATTGTLALVSDLTTGYIPYTGGTSNVDLGIHNLTVDTNSLFVDATNHRVGIGTTSPTVGGIQVANTGGTFTSIPSATAALGQISQTGWSGTGFVIGSAANNAFSMVQSGSTSYFGRITGTAVTQWMRLTDTGLRYGTSGSTAVNTLDIEGNAAFGSYAGTAAPSNGLIVSGNVGIGNTNPGNKLEVTGNIYASVNVQAGNSFYLSSKDLLFYGTPAVNDSGNAYTFANAAGTTFRQIKVSSLYVSSGTSGSELASINTSGGAYFSGSVGIGTTTPGAKLQINSGAITDKGAIIKGYAGQTANLQEWQDSTGAVKASVDKDGYINSAVGFKVAGYTLYSNVGGAAYILGSSYIAGDEEMPAANMRKWSSTTSAYGTPDLSLSRNAAGIVQIGDGGANANGRLLLSSGLVSAPSITFSGGGTNTGIFSSSNNIIDFVAGGTVQARYSSNGQFLPAAKLSSSNTSIIGWEPGVAGNTNMDTSLSRNAAGVLQIGDGAANANGSLLASQISLAKADSSALTDFLINPTAKTSGNLIDAQVGGVSKFSVTNAGITTTGLGFRLGSAATVSPYLFSFSGSSYTTPDAAGRGLAMYSYSVSNADVGIAFSGESVGSTASYTNALFARNFTNTAGTGATLAIKPTYNQVASTAANTDLLINRTETAVGSGAQYLIDAQVGGATKFNIDNSGVVTANNFTTKSSPVGEYQVKNGTNDVVLRLDTLGLEHGSGMLNTWRSTVDARSGSNDVSLSRNAAGVLQIGDGAANANGGLLASQISLLGNATSALTVYAVDSVNGTSEHTVIDTTGINSSNDDDTSIASWNSYGATTSFDDGTDSYFSGFGYSGLYSGITPSIGARREVSVTPDGMIFTNGTMGAYLRLVPAVGYTGNNIITMPSTTGTLALLSDIPSLSGYIPYTGGTSNVDLGIHNLTVDTNSLFVDSANHRVGIGTITPGEKLEVAGNIALYSNSATAQSIKLDVDNMANSYDLKIVAGSYGSSGTPGGNLYLSGGANIGLAAYGSVLIATGGGKVGIGTTSPTNILSLGNGVAQKIWIENTASGTMGRALTVAAGGTVAGGTNIVGGNLILTSGAGTGTGASSISFLTGTTLASGTTLQTLSEKMTILGSGNVGIGATSPSNIFHVTGTPAAGTPTARIANTLGGTTQNNGLLILGGNNTGVAASQLITFQRTDATVIGSVSQNAATTVAFNTSSDMRIKEDIAPTALGLSDLMKINVADFAFVSDPSKQRMTGFIAQELNNIYPEAVTTNGDNGIDPLSPGETPWMVDYSKLTPLLVKSVQDLDLNLESITGTVIPLPGSPAESFVVAFFDRMDAWMADTTNGIGDFFANRVHTKELCVTDLAGETCITRTELDNLLAGTAASGGGSTVSTTPDSSTGSEPMTCTASQILVDNVCVDSLGGDSTGVATGDTPPAPPVCPSPQTLVDNTCVDPAPAAPVPVADGSTPTPTP
ncbi:MAG: tail fiber domain-containing protein [Candidatus Paceibacterota bacterium]|jgi:hypothetical protein